MDNLKKPRRKPVLAIISIVCTALAVLMIIIGLICMLWLSQIDNNWGMIIVGLILLIIPGIFLGVIATILALISLLRKERLAISIVSIAISAPIIIFAITSIITGL